MDPSTTPPSSQQELCGLNESSPVFRPPTAKLLRVIPGYAVGNRERQPGRGHLLGMLHGIDAGGDHGDVQRVQFILGLLPLGQLPNAVGSPVTTIEKQRGVATGSALRKADSLAGQQLKRELGKPVPLLHLVSHDSLHFFGVLRRRPIPRSRSRAACIFRPMITTTSPVGNPRMFGGVRRVEWSGRPAYGYRAFSLTPVIPVGAGIRRPFYHREHKERRVFCIWPGDARTSVHSDARMANCVNPCQKAGAG